MQGNGCSITDFHSYIQVLLSPKTQDMLVIANIKVTSNMPFCSLERSSKLGCLLVVSED